MANFHENLISIDEAGTLDGLFASRVRRTPDREAYRYFDKDGKSWLSYTWGEMATEVARWQTAMRGENVSQGGRVAIQLRNCPQWVMFDQAALSLGLVTVPLYTDDRPDNIAYILRDADVCVLLVQDALPGCGVLSRTTGLVSCARRRAVTPRGTACNAGRRAP